MPNPVTAAVLGVNGDLADGESSIINPESATPKEATSEEYIIDFLDEKTKTANGGEIDCSKLSATFALYKCTLTENYKGEPVRICAVCNAHIGQSEFHFRKHCIARHLPLATTQKIEKRKQQGLGGLGFTSTKRNKTANDRSSSSPSSATNDRSSS